MKTLKTDIYTAIAAYLLKLDHEGTRALPKEEKRKIREAMKNALNMLMSLKEPVDPDILDNALANLLAYLVSNGKNTYAEKCNHLSRIVLKTNLILTMVKQTPVAEVLDMVHDKKKHPFTRIFNFN